jgi:hypothetical protein
MYYDDKEDILRNPANYPWNYILRYIQFSQDEILFVKEWIEIYELVRYQTSITRQFLRKHFKKDIDNSLEIDWNDVEKYVINY